MEEPSIELRAKRLARRIEEEVTSAYSEFGRRLLVNTTSVPYLHKCMLWFAGEYFDIHAKWYLTEISEYEQIQSRYGPVLIAVAKQAYEHTDKIRGDWAILAHVAIRTVGPMLLQSRIEHWKAEALKKIREIEEGVSKSKPLARRGYRDEVRGWMVKNQIPSVPVAAKHLGVSVDTLKSIMSEKGRARYSQDTLRSVLATIRQQ